MKILKIVCYDVITIQHLILHYLITIKTEMDNLAETSNIEEEYNNFVKSQDATEILLILEKNDGCPEKGYYYAKLENNYENPTFGNEKTEYCFSKSLK